MYTGKNYLLKRWPVYILFVVFIIVNITIEYMDTGENNQERNKTLRIIQLVTNIVIILLMITFLYSSREYIRKLSSGATVKNDSIKFAGKNTEIVEDSFDKLSLPGSLGSLTVYENPPKKTMKKLDSKLF
jgi:heme/copper-type cytochrome/quinol oxidase subunit 2